MAYRHPLSFLLGLEGIALLRADAGDGFGVTFVADRLAEIRALLAASDRGEFGDGDQIGSIDTVTGYRAWSASYDDPGNPLMDPLWA